MITRTELFYKLIISLIFVYIFVQFLTMKRSNGIFSFYNDYIMNKYCLIFYILVIFIIAHIDSYTAILLFILIIIPFRFAFKEYFENSNTTTGNIVSKTDDLIGPELAQQVLGIDNRFKVDEVKNKEILRQIKAQVDFDPYKTNLAKDVIYEIYNKYFDNDIFVKLKTVDDDSAQYVASGNFRYLPEPDKVDFDQITYQNLSYNTAFGVNPLTDGISNQTNINRG
jgi:hypothetical protein